LTVTVLAKSGRIGIPKVIRERLGLRAGQRFEVDALSDGTILVVPIPEDVVDSMRLPDAGRLEKALREERKKDRMLDKGL
jgi:AbrB family looped-hinge helix DNA binding protein